MPLPRGRLACLGLVGHGRRAADHLDAWPAQPLVRGECGLGGGQVAQAAGQFDGALRGLRREPMRLNGAQRTQIWSICDLEDAPIVVELG